MADITVESGLTRLRRSILLRTDLATCKIEASFGAPLGLLCALARNCFLAGYVWLAQDDERARVASLRARIQTSLRDATEEALAIVAMYMPLRTLSESPTLRERKWTSEFMPVAKEQIDDWLVETELAARLIPATAIDDDVSLAVREQYESNPYPRWVSVGDPGLISFGRLYEHLVGHAPATPPSEPLRILIAGCGSGRHPVQAARGFPAADILAIDLSLASLAYASRMTAALGIGNVTYRQGDILKLSQLDTKFDIVESCGVLHHLRDPMAGWRVLRGLLAPDGLMQIALYSRHARESVNRARALAHALGISGKADDLRRFRHTIADLPESDPTRGVVRWSDFFSLDEFRDLVMHVQEHQFTLPQIGQCVSELGLRVLALEVEGETKTDFERMFPGRDPRTDLQAWDRFEQAHPDTFRGMYRFWCRAA